MTRSKVCVVWSFVLALTAGVAAQSSFWGHVWIPVGVTEGRSNLAIYLDEVTKRGCTAQLPAPQIKREDPIHPLVYDVQYACPTKDVGPWVPDGASPAILIPTAAPTAPVPVPAPPPTPTLATSCTSPRPYPTAVCYQGPSGAWGWR